MVVTRLNVDLYWYSFRRIIAWHGFDGLPPNGKAQPPLRAAENCQNAPDLVRAAVGCSEGWAAWLE